MNYHGRRPLGRIFLIFGLPAARLKGLYLAIATLAAQYILQDFFARANWFTGGVAGTVAAPYPLFGYAFNNGAAGAHGMADLASCGKQHRPGAWPENQHLYLREMAIGAVIIVFLIFEPDGLADRWKQIKAHWRIYPFSH